MGDAACGSSDEEEMDGSGPSGRIDMLDLIFFPMNMFYLMLVASSYYFSPSDLLFHQFCTAIIFLLSSVYDSKDSVSISSVRFFGSVFFCPPLRKGGEKAASPTHTVNTTERRHAASGRVHPWPMKRKREREREGLNFFVWAAPWKQWAIVSSWASPGSPN
jgi:hypothetical protein